jgi:hypothetical protein
MSDVAVVKELGRARETTRHLKPERKFKDVVL